ncbi:hypothetical protein HDV01_001176 [Terramyces sp. JEL0728]|nr:hypothetical protein HDV01_001176 [Terramyces sp. JEL0728]
MDENEKKCNAITKPGTIGICAMDTKARSKPMRNILDRLLASGDFLLVTFGDKVILDEPVDHWPLCDFLISFFSTGFPLEKAIEYVKLRKPVCLNDLPMQQLLLDRRLVLAMLDAVGVPTPSRLVTWHQDAPVLTKEVKMKAKRIGFDIEKYANTTITANMVGTEEIQVENNTLKKPFVEKPVSGEDHNIYIYYSKEEGGGIRKLFRKKGNKSSEYFKEESDIRYDGANSYIYEEFMQVDNAEDVKVYTIGQHYSHAETRKSPVVDGVVRRNADGKEIRYVTELSAEEKEIARKVCLTFGQIVCGFDLLRANGKSYVIDVNGWSFVKGNQDYYDESASRIRKIFLNEVTRRGNKLVRQQTFSSKGQWNMKAFLSVMRHADRTPKQKVKFFFETKPFLELVRGCEDEIVYKTIDKFQIVIDTVKSCIENSIGDVDALKQIDNILEHKGKLSGTKVQLRPIFDKGTKNFKKMQLIIKWGGLFTHAGYLQSKDLGENLRTDLNIINKDLIQDLKVISSSEKRVIDTAETFCKALLDKDIPSDLIVINKEMLDDSNAAKEQTDFVKSKLQHILNPDMHAKPPSVFVMPEGWTDFAGPIRAMIELMKRMRVIMDENLKVPRSKVEFCCFENEKLFLERWEKLFREFCDVEHSKFEPSKISELYDALKFDLLHNRAFLYYTFKYDNENLVQSLCVQSKALFDIIGPHEFGIENKEKLEIGKTNTRFLLNSIHTGLVAASISPNPLTRLYFTKESKVYCLLNVVLLNGLKTKVIPTDIAELDYLTQITFELYERNMGIDEDRNDPEFSVRIGLSPGAHDPNLIELQLDSSHALSVQSRKWLTDHIPLEEALRCLLPTATEADLWAFAFAPKPRLMNPTATSLRKSYQIFNAPYFIAGFGLNPPIRTYDFITKPTIYSTNGKLHLKFKSFNSTFHAELESSSLDFNGFAEIHGDDGVQFLPLPYHTVYNGIMKENNRIVKGSSAQIVITSQNPLTMEGSIIMDTNYHIKQINQYKRAQRRMDVEIASPLSRQPEDYWSDYILIKEDYGVIEKHDHISHLIKRSPFSTCATDTSAYTGKSMKFGVSKDSSNCPLPNKKILLMGVAADCSYVQAKGGVSQALQSILSNWNSATQTYESAFNVQLGVGKVMIQQSCTADKSLAWNVDCSNPSFTISNRLSAFAQWRGTLGDDGLGLWHLMTQCSTQPAVGIAWLSTLCQQNAVSQSDPSGSGGTVFVSGVGVSSIVPTEWKVVAHEIGHNFGAIHDCTDSTCSSSGTSNGCSPCSPCNCNSQFLMNPLDTATTNNFSSGSTSLICSGISQMGSKCLKDPSQVSNVIQQGICGNGVREGNEQCDCGTPDQCKDKCCNASTCTFASGAVCSGADNCCNASTCQLLAQGTSCHKSQGVCDTDAVCTGTNATCPTNTFFKDGTSCVVSGTNAQCASGICTSRDLQCKASSLGSAGTGGNINIVTNSACPGFGNDCGLKCQDNSGNCYVLNGNFVGTYSINLDGTSCGGDGRCKNGSCEGASLFGMASVWINAYPQYFYPLLVLTALVVISVIWSCAKCCYYKSFARKKPARQPRMPKAPRPTLPSQVTVAENVPEEYPGQTFPAPERRAKKAKKPRSNEFPNGSGEDLVPQDGQNNYTQSDYRGERNQSGYQPEAWQDQYQYRSLDPQQDYRTSQSYDPNSIYPNQNGPRYAQPPNQRTSQSYAAKPSYMQPEYQDDFYNGPERR